MAPQRRWFRLYVDELTSQTMRQLKPPERWLRIAVLAAACDSPVPGVLLITDTIPMDIDDLAGYAGMTTRSTRAGVERLKALGLIYERADGAFVATDWDSRRTAPEYRESIPDDLRLRVLVRDGYTCVRPGCGATEYLHIDHRMPVALGGLGTFENLQVLCRPCNLAKGAKHPDLWEATWAG